MPNMNRICWVSQSLFQELFCMHSVFTAQSIGNKWPSYALDFFYSPSPVFKAI